MTQDEIIEMARQAGMEKDGDMWFSNLFKTDMDVHISHLEHFAKLVAAKEREVCAEICDYEADDFTEGDWDTCCNYLAKKIRARGEQA
jgi:hypothetical protein